jgi:hypothetical protein
MGTSTSFLVCAAAWLSERSQDIRHRLIQVFVEYLHYFSLEDRDWTFSRRVCVLNKSRDTMEDVPESRFFSFPEEEEKILKYWESIDAFEEQLKRTEGKPEYVFFDGPPFATGMPHYGHLLAGTIKVWALSS